MKALSRDDYTVGWISPLEVEWTAARALLDEEHEEVATSPGDHNRYLFGEIRGQTATFNVVIGALPAGFQGNVAAGNLANQMLAEFPKLDLKLLVGIGGAGGDPARRDIRLGDVVIGQPDGRYNGFVQYDFGKETVSGWQYKGQLGVTPPQWLATLNKLKSDHDMRGSQAPTYLRLMLEKHPRLKRRYARPQHDRLFRADYIHIQGQATCIQCDQDSIMERAARDVIDEPVVHYGLIASADRVMKDATQRDLLSEDLGGVECFEMEAAGLMTETGKFKCVVIRGISDYADSHKNDDWHGYAAAAAAAVAKELLTYMRPSDQGQDASGRSGD